MMKKILVLTFLLSVDVAMAVTWKKIIGKQGAGPAGCPSNYVPVPKLSPFTTRDFCVAKFEMKNDGYGTAVSEASAAVWVNVDRATARAACQALGAGYDLISNDQWQNIALNIASTSVNWSGAVVDTGELNRGHSDNAPASVLTAVADDTDACNGTGETCSNVLWHSQRRTHTLSNGSVIWDFAGNVWEWVTNDNTAAIGADGYISTIIALADRRQTHFGGEAECVDPGPLSNYCGMGYGFFNYAGPAIGRGGYYGYGIQTGIFSAYLGYPLTESQGALGFRCVFVP